MTEAPTSRRRSIRLPAAAIAVAAVAALTLAPRAIVAPARELFMGLVGVFAEPLAVMLPQLGAERVLNAIMFVPLGATVALLLSRRFWPLAIVAGFALSATVEYAQATIPGRVPDPADVFWNTLGGAVGVVVITAIRGAAAMGRRSGASRALSRQR